MSLYLKRVGREETFLISPDKEKILIGRSIQCDISFPSLHISRQHCQIIRSPPNGALVIKNIRDSNCTYVNEVKLQDPDVCVELQIGSRIGLGVPLDLATEDGLRNNNYVFLKLEEMHSSLQTRSSQEERLNNQEMYNPAEASLVYVLLEILQPHLSKKTVGIITPYQRQRIYLEEKLAKFKGMINLSINTIDGFQGQERDVIILSFVRANNSASIGFLSHRQRLNVALTRAKNTCYIVASLSSLEGNEDWKSLIRNGRTRGLVCPVSSREENDKNFLRSVVMRRDYK